MDAEQEKICKAIDLRLKQQSMLLVLESEWEDKINPKVRWVGKLIISGGFSAKIIKG